jgi:hypothetical protein
VAGGEWVLGILDRIFGKREYIIYVPRRGGRKVLGKVTARDVNEAQEIVLRMIADMEDADLTKAKYIKIFDPRAMQEFDVENPKYEEPEEPKKRGRDIDEVTVEDLEKLTILTVTEKLPTIVDKSIEISFRLTDRLVNKVMDLWFKQVEERLGLKQENPQVMVAGAVAKALEAFAQNPQGLVSAVKALAGIGDGVGSGNSKVELAKIWLTMGAPRKIREEIKEGG